MKISIIVPTCGPAAEDTFSPKGSAFQYPASHHDDSTTSTASSTDRPEYTRHSRRTYNSFNRENINSFSGENQYTPTGSKRYTPGENRTTPEPLSSSNIYNKLVVGQQSQYFPQSPQYVISKNRSLTPNTLPMENSESSSSTDCDSSESSVSREYNARSRRSHRVENAIESMPVVKAKASIGSALRPPTSQKQGKLPGKRQSKESVERIACAAEAMENDLFAMFGSLRCMLGIPDYKGTPDNEDDDAEEEINENEVPITRLSADLRKQRLRNQVLLYERDTLTQQLKERFQENQEMKKRMHVLEAEKEQVEARALEKSQKIAEMMNDLLEMQIHISELEASQA